MNDLLPTWLKQTTIEDNKLSLRYSNGSQIKQLHQVEMLVVLKHYPC